MVRDSAFSSGDPESSRKRGGVPLRGSADSKDILKMGRESSWEREEKMVGSSQNRPSGQTRVVPGNERTFP